jgi:hypothetical protein
LVVVVAVVEAAVKLLQVELVVVELFKEWFMLL